MNNIISKAQKRFDKMIKENKTDPYHLIPHLSEIEKWAKYLLKKHLEADPEVVVLAVWLHDIGHYPINPKIDHAIVGEKRAKEFLKKEKYPKEKMDKVLHCVRAHRCKDVLPQTIEAKIVACADSASHMTEPMYFDVAMTDKKNKVPFRAYGKMERDFRDIGIFPEVQNELRGLHAGWKKVICEYEKINLE